MEYLFLLDFHTENPRKNLLKSDKEFNFKKQQGFYFYSYYYLAGDTSTRCLQYDFNRKTHVISTIPI